MQWLALDSIKSKFVVTLKRKNYTHTHDLINRSTTSFKIWLVRVFENRKEPPKILNGVLPHARVTLTTAGVSSSKKPHRKNIPSARPTNRPPHESALVHGPIAFDP
jgi:hypothetical protein